MCHVMCHDTYIRGDEDCEDANVDPNDGCNNCVETAMWTCSSVNGRFSQCIPTCGNGLIEGAELCDDGDETDGMGCRADCSGELPGWNCTGLLAFPPFNVSICTSDCGDGIKVIGE